MEAAQQVVDAQPTCSDEAKAEGLPSVAPAQQRRSKQTSSWVRGYRYALLTDAEWLLVAEAAEAYSMTVSPFVGLIVRNYLKSRHDLVVIAPLKASRKPSK